MEVNIFPLQTLLIQIIIGLQLVQINMLMMHIMELNQLMTITLIDMGEIRMIMPELQ